jgi:hypothetical protein
MRKKKGKSLAPPDLSAAWQSVFENSRITDVAPLRAAGWKTVREIADELNFSYSGAARMLSNKSERGLLDKCLHKVNDGNGGARTIAFYRPARQSGNSGQQQRK